MSQRVADSLRGLQLGWQRERAIRAHISLSAIGMVVLAIDQPPISWFFAAIVMAFASFAVELINASIEALLDRIHPDVDPTIGAAKDMSSGASFLFNVCAAATFFAALLA